MKRVLHLFVFLLFAPLAVSAQTVRFMPQWTPQTQFAGYYVALAKGFYDEEGLTVVLDHFGGSSTESVVGKLSSGKVDIITSQLVSAMAERDRGTPMVNILQTSQVNGLMCVSHYGIDTPGDLNNRKIGRWKVGFAEICEIFCYRNGLQVQWIPYISGVNLYVSRAVDALLCYSYSEFLQLDLATGGIPERNVLRFSDMGFNYPEDGLYVTEDYYMNNRDVVDKFVRASRRGWDYAREHPEETLEISMQIVEEFDVVTNRTIQWRMLQEILRLQVNPSTGKADYAPVGETVFNELGRLLLETDHIKRIPDYKNMIR